MADQTCTYQLTDNCSQVGSQSLHSVLEILWKVGSVVSEFQNLVTKSNDVFLISLTDFSSHWDLSSILYIFLDVFRNNAREISVYSFVSLSHSFHNFSVDEVIRYNFGELGEVPSIPLFESHCVVIDFFVKIIKKRDSLNDHNIHLFSWEFESVSWESVGNTQSHHLVVFFVFNYIKILVRLSRPAMLNLITLINSSIWSFCLHSRPSSSVNAFPSLLSATAIVYWTSFSMTFLERNLESDLGILPFMSFEMHLNASAVLLNL